MHFIILLVAALCHSFASAIPAIPLETPSDAVDISPSPPPNRVTTYPVCGTLGFTSRPGDHDLGVFPPGRVCLAECVGACRRNATCRAVSWAADFELCSFYGRPVREDQLDEDPTSRFGHWDEICDVGEGKGNGTKWGR